MGKACIVILNYNDFEDTVECIKSIRSLNYDDSYEVVIVDNGSSNNSYEYLSKRYSDEGNIAVLETGRNPGYAAGNNIGIDYGVKNGAEYICILNNGTAGLQQYLMERNRVVFVKRNIKNKILYAFFLAYLYSKNIVRCVIRGRRYLCYFSFYKDGIRNQISHKYPFIIINQ